VFLVEWEESAPDLPGVLLRRRTVGEVGASLARADRHAVLLLGDGALAALDPRSVARTFLGPAWRVLASPARFQEDDLQWRIPGSIELHDRDHLPEALRQAVRALQREPPPRLEVLGRPLPRSAALLGSYEALESVTSLSVQGWARAWGRSRHEVDDLWVEGFGLRPREIVWRFRDALVRWERAWGTALRGIAVQAGYADVPTLLNTYRRRGIRFPPRGGGGGRRSKYQ
jgi:hypothetical protein